MADEPTEVPPAQPHQRVILLVGLPEDVPNHMEHSPVAGLVKDAIDVLSMLGGYTWNATERKNIDALALSVAACEDWMGRYRDDPIKKGGK